MINRKVLAIIMALLLVAAGYWYMQPGATSSMPAIKADTGIKVGQNLAPFTLTSLDGSQVTVEPTGKIIVINFWATWCPPCREEMPELEQFAQKNRQKIDFFGINLQESKAKISEFMLNNHYTMPVLLDQEAAMAKKFNVTAIPTTIIINKHGMIKYRKPGAMTSNELEGIINSL